MSRHSENRHSEIRLNATSVSSTYREDKQTGASDGRYGLLFIISCNKYVTGLHFRFPNIYPVKVSLQNDLVFLSTGLEEIYVAPSGKEWEVPSLAAAFFTSFVPRANASVTR